MTTEKSSISDVWAARFDDRDDEDLAVQMWSRRLASREQAMAQPFKNFPMADEMGSGGDKPTPAAQSDRPR
jgi:hypothetical protein